MLICGHGVHIPLFSSECTSSRGSSSSLSDCSSMCSRLSIPVILLADADILCGVQKTEFSPTSFVGASMDEKINRILLTQDGARSLITWYIPLHANSSLL